MGRETIGSVSEWEPGWETDMAYEMAKTFLAHALGNLPPGTSIEMVWLDHDLGSYPALAVCWEDGHGRPQEFVQKAENALWEFDRAIDWSRIRPSRFLDEEEDD